VSFADTNEQEWFAPHLVDLDYGGEQTMAINDGLNAWPALRAGHIDRAAEYERLVRAFSR
jgi:hypothetical protein